MNELEKELRFIRAELRELLSRSGARPVAYSMETAAWAVGFGLTKFRELVKSKKIDTFTVDRRRLVRVAELERWAEAQSTPISVRVPKTRRKTESEKARSAPKR